ncbi:hypothetical protein Dda_6735 [Drechslerella dactyloides]|uniref:CSN8/PSMD8/EIF3K domain-containing protein n=1 Tax=Drechslerella dactyloides TaxID=74499 RepID=A0AAD6NGG6_DREDA|nr:hypothetical protein Dda_6735 [Drechslerella dactyloides]
MQHANTRLSKSHPDADFDGPGADKLACAGASRNPGTRIQPATAGPEIPVVAATPGVEARFECTWYSALVAAPLSTSSPPPNVTTSPPPPSTIHNQDDHERTSSNMGSKIPPLTTTLLSSLLADTAPSAASPPESLVAALASLEPRAGITTVDASTTDALSAYYSSYILALLLANDLSEARHLAHRIDSSLLASDAAVQAATSVLAAVRSKDYVAFHDTMQSAPWGDVATVIASRLLQTHRTQTLHLLTTAYTSLPPTLAARYLGTTDEPRTIAMLVDDNPSLGWSFDADSGVLRVTAGSDAVGRGRPAKEGEIGRLAGLGGFLSDS